MSTIYYAVTYILFVDVIMDVFSLFNLCTISITVAHYVFNYLPADTFSCMTTQVNISFLREHKGDMFI